MTERVSITLQEGHSPAEMANYSKKEKDEIIRDYFGPPGAEENPRCPLCGELLQFNANHRPDGNFQIQVSCPECQTSFSWKQIQQEQPWKPLHLNYFIERYGMNATIRCPFDDCYVIYTEFSDGVLEFRCPYCNHRGKAQLPSPDDS